MDHCIYAPFYPMRRLPASHDDRRQSDEFSRTSVENNAGTEIGLDTINEEEYQLPAPIRNPSPQADDVHDHNHNHNDDHDHDHYHSYSYSYSHNYAYISSDTPDFAVRSGPSTTFVARRPIEGDCSICMLPLRYEESDSDSSDTESMTSTESEFWDPPGPDADADSESEEADAEPEPEPHAHVSGSGAVPVWGQMAHDSHGLLWCRRQCGNNFHGRCIDRWSSVESFGYRRPTCPVCRRAWVD